MTALINDDTVPLGEDGDQNVTEPDAQDDQEETQQQLAVTLAKTVTGDCKKVIVKVCN